MKLNLSDAPRLRAALYAVASAVLGLLGGVGIVDAAQAEQWEGIVEHALELVFALVLVLAHRNTPKKGAERRVASGDASAAE